MRADSLVEFDPIIKFISVDMLLEESNDISTSKFQTSSTDFVVLCNHCK